MTREFFIALDLNAFFSQYYETSFHFVRVLETLTDISEWSQLGGWVKVWKLELFEYWLFIILMFSIKEVFHFSFVPNIRILQNPQQECLEIKTFCFLLKLIKNNLIQVSIPWKFIRYHTYCITLSIFAVSHSVHFYIIQKVTLKALLNSLLNLLEFFFVLSHRWSVKCQATEKMLRTLSGDCVMFHQALALIPFNSMEQRVRYILLVTARLTIGS